MICSYCKGYCESSARTLSGRFCRSVMKEVEGIQEACPKFVQNPIFWCNKQDQWTDVLVCQHRKKLRREGCVNCKQGKLFFIKPIRKSSRIKEESYI